MILRPPRSTLTATPFPSTTLFRSLPTAVNNNIVGSADVGAALLFFVLAGCLALLMRSQLATPMAEIVGQETYNQLFTMHGTVMMFLFADRKSTRLNSSH